MGKHKKSLKNRRSPSSGDERSKKKHKSSSSKDERPKKKHRRSYSSEDERPKRKHRSYSSEEESSKRNYDSSSEEERIVRRNRNKKKSRATSSESSSSTDGSEFTDKQTTSSEPRRARDEWMNLTSGFATTSNAERKRERDEKKKSVREKQQYDPRTCDRELNPYWKSGGDGLPTFRKPVDSDEDERKQSYKSRDSHRKREASWKKPRNKLESAASKPSVSSHAEQPEETIKSTNETNEEVVTQKDLNLLASKLLKAEIMGNTELVKELKEKLERARNSVTSRDEEVILTRTDSKGRSQPVKLQSEYGEASDHKKKKKVETHKDGQRVRYFADDDKYSLKQMFENEKFSTVEDSNNEFSKMAGKIRKNDDLDDIFADNIRKKDSDEKVDLKNRDKAIQEHQRITKTLDGCNRCIQSEAMPKHLMIAMGETAYLALPAFEPLTEGHCFIIPIRHVPSSTQLDENEWSDILEIKKSLIKLFKSKGEDVIFFESAKYLHRFPHMTIECIPLPKEEGDMAPIYFKKAIDESETEWAQNKKLVSLRGRDVRRAVPKGLPYFFVTFGIGDGYAHVIEDEQLFPSNFAQEIVGGMLDLHHSKWKRPKKQTFDEQSKRVLAFSNEWKKFDCTGGLQ